MCHLRAVSIFNSNQSLPTCKCCHKSPSAHPFLFTKKMLFWIFWTLPLKRVENPNKKNKATTRQNLLLNCFFFFTVGPIILTIFFFTVLNKTTHDFLFSISPFSSLNYVTFFDFDVNIYANNANCHYTNLIQHYLLFIRNKFVWFSNVTFFNQV